MAKIKTINRVHKPLQYNHTLNEIIEFNGKKFKIHANIRNGGTTLQASIMKGDGSFEVILAQNDVDFTYTEYCGGENGRILNDLSSAIIEMTKVIVKVYG